MLIVEITSSSFSLHRYTVLSLSGKRLTLRKSNKSFPQNAFNLQLGPPTLFWLQRSHLSKEH